MSASEWQRNMSYAASSLRGDAAHTEMWFGPVQATRNGSFVSLWYRHPGDDHPRSLLLPADQLTEIAAASHNTTSVLLGETFRTLLRDGNYEDET
jgi:hypothetical protein